jgi:hypothetical protein
MVGIVIAFPGLVTGNLEHIKVDPSKVQIIIPDTGYGEPGGEDVVPIPGTGDAPGDGSGDDAGAGDDLEKAFGGSGDDQVRKSGDKKDDSGLSDLEKDLLGR